MAEVITKDVDDEENFGGIRQGRLDFYYNRMGHKLTKLFYIIIQPEEEEKLPAVTLKIIDNLLSKQIPKICDFFIFNSLRKVL